MSSCLALVATLAAAAPPSLAAPVFTTVGLDAEVGRFASEHVAQKLTERGLKVVTAREMSTLIGAERERQLMGCEASGCVAELADALGTDAVIFGEVAKLGTQVQVNLKVASSRSGGAKATFSRRVRGEDAILEALDEGAEALAAQLLPHESAGPAPVATGPARWPVFAAAGVAVAGAAVGTVFLLQAQGAEAKLREPRTDGVTAWTPSEADALVKQGNEAQVVARVGYGLAAAGAVGAAALWFLTGREAPKGSVSVSAVAGPGGGGVVVGGSFP